MWGILTSKPLPPGAADLNIRNSPARLLRGLTPPPKSTEPLIVKSWSIDADGKSVPAPDYTVRVVLPGMPVKVLKTMTVKPAESWARAKLSEAAATVEIPLK